MHKRVMCYSCQPIGGDRKNTYRNKHFKQKYGITLAEYKIMYEAQGGCCKLCSRNVHYTGMTLVSGGKRDASDPCVDHYHTTGRVRGILCFHCNLLLGHIFDDISYIDKIKEYLKE